MSVKAIAVTKGLGELEEKSAQEIISYVARVSNPPNQLNFDTASKLLKYCLKHKHFSIFEHAFLTVEIKTSMSIGEQILRHRSFVFQKFSQRYAKASKNIKYKARRQDFKNRQNSLDDLPQDVQDWFDSAQDQVWELNNKLYEEALEKGIAKECSRFLLPMNTETTMYMTGSVRSWIHYIETRTDPSTQKEHRDIALQCREIFCQHFPDVADALGWLNEKEENLSK